ncbi:MAG: hypothetical protein V1891_01175 [bacterium]
MALIILICFLAIGVVNIRAGSLTPSGAPAASGYTLGDIYVRLATNATATVGNHDLATTTSPTGTFYTLTQIYSAIPTITANTVKLGTSYLGVAGSLIPNGGVATTSDVLIGKTYFGADQADWNLATGAYNASNLATSTVKSGTAFGVGLTGDYPSAAYPLGGDTGATDATTAEICNTKEAWLKTGVMIVGTLNPTASTIISGATICGVAGTATPNPLFGDNDAGKVLTTSGTGPGTYDATNLTPENVRKNITFGVGQTGSFEIGYGYGSDNATGVLTTAAGTPGTFNVSNLDNSLIKSGITWGVSLGSTGTLLPNGGTAIAADLFNAKTAHLNGDWNLDTGTLNLACNTATFDGAGNLVADGYDGAGNGANRWCMATSTNSVAVGDILLGKKAWVDGAEITGAMPTQTLSADNDTVSLGYYEATTLSAVDADLISANIKSGINLFGVGGSFVGGYTYGDSVQSTVLTTATGAGTYNASNLTVSNVRYGQTFGVSSTGAMSPYPNTPSGISGLDSTVCAAASWTWVEDSNNDGVSDDPICVNPNREAAGATKVWNTNVGNDNTFIGNYGCSGDTNGDGVGTLNATLTGTVSENAGYGDDAATAIAIADCKDGIRNLLSMAEVESSGYTAPDTDCTPTTNDCYNGPLTPKALMEWKGTRLPSNNDFFGVCGNGTTSKTFGNYGNQIGRTDNVIAANLGSWEWLSEQHYRSSARLAGTYACSYFSYDGVTTSYEARVVFRP